jgi:hypothetical protein
MPLSQVHWRGKKALLLSVFYLFMYNSQADANGVVFTSQVFVICLFIYLCKKKNS